MLIQLYSNALPSVVLLVTLETDSLSAAPMSVQTTNLRAMIQDSVNYLVPTTSLLILFLGSVSHSAPLDIMDWSRKESVTLIAH